MINVFVDLETGGLLPHHPNIQIAAVAVDAETWMELDAFEQKISFDFAFCDPAALKANSYNAAQWAAHAVSPSIATDRLAKFLKRHSTLCLTSKKTGRPYSVAKLFAHNAAFDGPRLQAMFERERLFMPADYRIRCTLQAALWYFERPGLTPPENYQLSTLCRYFGAPVADAHDALGDVRMTAMLAKELLKGDRNVSVQG